MNQRIIYTNNEGNVCVVIPSPEWAGTMQELQDKLQAEGSLRAIDIPEIVFPIDIPTDRTLRNAWKRGEQNKKIGVDMVRGKGIAHDKRRAKRSAEFVPLDVEATIPSKAAQAEAARQVLRNKYDDMQIAIDACTTPEQLKAIIDTEGL